MQETQEEPDCVSPAGKLVNTVGEAVGQGEILARILAAEGLVPIGMERDAAKEIARFLFGTT